MAEPIRVCTDRVLGAEARRNASLAERRAPRLARDVERLALPVKKKWANGRTLRVAFLDGEAELRERVTAVAAQWVAGTSLTFDFEGPTAEADLRVGFALPGSWSYVGTDALTAPPEEATIGLGWLDPSSSDDVLTQTVLHEFGHALGAVHEHQSPDGGIPWDREAVLAFYAGPPNRWTEAEVEANIFAKYEAELTQFSAFDRDSIMLYAVAEELTAGQYAVDWNRTVSPVDRDWIAIAYPPRHHDPGRLLVDGPAASAEIGAHGEWDEFDLTIDRPGRYVVETEGPTDVMMALVGSGDRERIVAEDDDSGRDGNARIEAALAAGDYVVRIWHHWPTGTGPYGITTRRAPL